MHHQGGHIGRAWMLTSSIPPFGWFCLSLLTEERASLAPQGIGLAEKEPRCHALGLSFSTVVYQLCWFLTFLVNKECKAPTSRLSCCHVLSWERLTSTLMMKHSYCFVTMAQIQQPEYMVLQLEPIINLPEHLCFSEKVCVFFENPAQIRLCFPCAVETFGKEIVQIFK